MRELVRLIAAEGGAERRGEWDISRLGLPRASREAIERRLEAVSPACNELLAWADVVTLHVPFTEETKGLIGARELALMKPGALLVNCARGGVVDEEALVAALDAGRLGGAAIDVFAEEPPPPGHPFFGLDNAIVSPHVSGFLPSYDDRCTDLFAENLRRYLARAPLLNLVDRARGY